MPASNPRAQSLVQRALKSGRLVKAEACELCGLPASAAGKRGLHGHHVDYDKPLEVQWLCPKCHRKQPSGIGGSGEIAWLQTVAQGMTAKIDAARGTTPRTQWVEEAILMRLRGPDYDPASVRQRRQQKSPGNLLPLELERQRREAIANAYRRSPK